MKITNLTIETIPNDDLTKTVKVSYKLIRTQGAAPELLFLEQQVSDAEQSNAVIAELITELIRRLLTSLGVWA